GSLRRGAVVRPVHAKGGTRGMGGHERAECGDDAGQPDGGDGGQAAGATGAGDLGAGHRVGSLWEGGSSRAGSSEEVSGWRLRLLSQGLVKAGQDTATAPWPERFSKGGRAT